MRNFAGQLLCIRKAIDGNISTQSLAVTSREMSLMEEIIVIGRKGRSDGPVARVLTSIRSPGPMIHLVVVINGILSACVIGGDELNGIIVVVLKNIKFRLLSTLQLSTLFNNLCPIIHENGRSLTTSINCRHPFD